MAMGLPRFRRWGAAAIAALACLLLVDLATGPDVMVIALYGIAPLLASFGLGWRGTGAVALAALALAAASRAVSDDMDSTNGFVFVFTVAVLGVLACGAAVMRTRREAAAVEHTRLVDEARAAGAELREAYGMLDAIFDRAPVGLAMFHCKLRYMRINDRLAEINGLPAAEHLGRPSPRSCPRSTRPRPTCAACSSPGSR